MAGVIYRFNLFRVQQWLKLPEFVTTAVSRMVGDVFSSAAPSAQPHAMGATLEIQRQQQIEYYERQAMTAARRGHLRNRVQKMKCASLTFLISCFKNNNLLLFFSHLSPYFKSLSQFLGVTDSP